MTSAGGADDLAALIRERFAFLADFGFTVEGVYDGAVVWRAGDRQVTVARDWRDGFTDVTLARGAVGAHSDYFSLKQAFQALGRLDAWPTHGWQAYDPELAPRYVEELADLLRAVAPELLSAASAGWDGAASVGREEGRVYGIGVVSRPARAKADAAWHRQDWATVIAQYDAVAACGAQLSHSERKRVEYARKHKDR